MIHNFDVFDISWHNISGAYLSEYYMERILFRDHNIDIQVVVDNCAVIDVGISRVRDWCACKHAHVSFCGIVYLSVCAVVYIYVHVMCVGVHVCFCSVCVVSICKCV